MSAQPLSPTYDIEVNEHTYTVRFLGVHAYIMQGAEYVPFVRYLSQCVPECLHVQFLKCVHYARKEFAV